MGIREVIQRECKKLRGIGLVVEPSDAAYDWRIAVYMNRGSIPYIVYHLNYDEKYPVLLTKYNDVYSHASMYEFHISKWSSGSPVAGWYTDTKTECPIRIIKTELYLAQLKELAQEIQILVETARERIMKEEDQND